MTENPKFKLLFDDRVGIVFDIAGLMARQGLNIIAMEVEQKGSFAQVSLEIERPQTLELESLRRLFASLPGIKSERVVGLLPREIRQKWFRTLFDGMSEGIISIDAKGVINTINAVACQILGQVYDEIIGHHISELSPKDSILLECIEKKIPISRRKMIVTDTGRVEFYGSAKLINDSQGNLVGAVLLMKDIREVRKMVDAVSTPLALTFDDFIGQSPAIKNLITFARKIANTGAIVSITGESGTGKELFAKALHYESGRTGPFIPINCAALPEALIESELFGHVDGAFTGARAKGKPGLFEAAGDGTIFLDEIGDMPPGTQAKILRVLQEGFIRRIGGVQEIPVNARVITATNKNLWEMTQQNKFREDLFYRINVFNILIPPLRERLMDIPPLATDFLHQFNRKLSKADQTINKGAMAKLYNHSWPGNVRELKNVIERAAVLSDGEDIAVDAILLSHEAADPGCPESVPGISGNNNSLKEQVGSYEVAILLDTLNATPSIREAARQLGVSHTGLLKKIKKYQLHGGSNKNQWSKNKPRA
ncbi:sigma 54-interacting transcriptional regulator [Desulfogranum mediterraneum]|uniref:sigma 54-interacting transcriptional regulator n=1 Tax=Desulfogranum mediterraneum TaxID=160661 RepID=UPI00041C99CD|nr:sigma 54-interacting transcriptional regulator [Desulfogranum mediterraneum]